MHGVKYTRLAHYTTAIKNLRTQIKSTPAPVSQSLLNSYVAAYDALAAYQAHGERVARTIPAIVTGRRNVTLVGVFPVAP